MPAFPITRLKQFFAAIEDRRFARRAPALFIGDSWFQYPLRSYPDLQRCISTEFDTQLIGLDDSVPGRDADEVQGLSGRWANIAADLAARGRPLKLICVSLGGNDVIGRDFARHLHGSNQNPGPVDWEFAPDIPPDALRRFRFDALRATFDRVQQAYGRIIEIRNRHAPDATLITHTYADVAPSDTPYKFAGIALSGPWIHDALNRAGIRDPQAQRVISRWLLQSFAGLMARIARRRKDFVVLDTRTELEDPALWDNEIHPVGKGYKQLARDHWFPAIRNVL
jgi:lysophospholipase L1-like esterase